MTQTVVVRLEKDLVDQLWLLTGNKIRQKKGKVSLSDIVRELLAATWPLIFAFIVPLTVKGDDVPNYIVTAKVSLVVVNVRNAEEAKDLFREQLNATGLMLASPNETLKVHTDK